jgi:hypothetical protein
VRLSARIRFGDEKLKHAKSPLFTTLLCTFAHDNEARSLGFEYHPKSCSTYTLAGMGRIEPAA